MFLIRAYVFTIGHPEDIDILLGPQIKLIKNISIKWILNPGVTVGSPTLWVIRSSLTPEPQWEIENIGYRIRDLNSKSS